MEDAFDIQNALKVMQDIEDGKIKIIEKNSSTPSPFAFNLFAQGHADILKMEGRLAFIQRMHEKIMKEIA
jgi:ATP-dependent Lhr-like helicase